MKSRLQLGNGLHRARPMLPRKLIQSCVHPDCHGDLHIRPAVGPDMPLKQLRESWH